MRDRLTVDRMDSKSILGRAVHRCSSASSMSAAVYVFNLCVVGAAAATAETTTPFMLLRRSLLSAVIMIGRLRGRCVGRPQCGDGSPAGRTACPTIH